MGNDIIETVEAERTSLDLHVDLCAQRYTQLINKFDIVDTKFTKIETMLVEIKESIKVDEDKNVSRYLKWAGAIIGLLSSTLIGLVLHLLLK